MGGPTIWITPVFGLHQFVVAAGKWCKLCGSRSGVGGLQSWRPGWGSDIIGRILYLHGSSNILLILLQISHNIAELCESVLEAEHEKDASWREFAT